jgi:hypothetical protein
MTYQFMQEETSAELYPTGVPTSVITISETKVSKLQEGPLPTPYTLCIFWDFITTWGGKLDVE